MPTVNNGIPFVPDMVVDPAAATNAGFNWIDALLQLRVLSVGSNSAPGSPANGDRHIVGAAATGAWSGQNNKLAQYLDGAWRFFTANYAVNATDGNFYIRGTAGTWAVVSGGGGGGGEANTGANLGTGTGIYAGKTGVALNFKSLQVATRLAISADADEITFGVESGYSIPPTAEQARWSFAADWVEANSTKLREKLTAARTYYVRSDGNDANDGLANTTGGAFLTMQRASDVIAALDISIYNVTVQVTAGVFESAVYRDPVGSGNINVFGQGDTTIFRRTATSGAAISFAGDSKKWRFNNLQYEAPNGTSANGVAVANNQQTQINNCTSGVCTGFHHNVGGSGAITVAGTHTIKGNAQAHWLCAYKGELVGAANVTLVGSIAFSQAFAICQMQALIRMGAITFTGSATGQRFTVGTQAQINVNGAGLTYLPGSTAGVVDTATGGLYI